MKNLIKKIFSPRNLGTVIAILLVTGATAWAAIPAYKSWLQEGTSVFTTGTNVGIGTSNPVGSLDISHPSPEVYIHDSNSLGSASVGILTFRDSANAGVLQLDFQGGTGRLINWINGSDIQFLTTIPSGTQTRMTLKADGNVGIGTITPAQKLTVAGGNIGLDSGRFLLWPNNSLLGGADLDINSVNNIVFRTGSPTGGTARLLIQGTNGNVGIGTVSPGAKLQVVLGDMAVTTQGNGLILRATNGANCYRITVDNAGTISSALVACP